jgi:hypothetical protein
VKGIAHKTLEKAKVCAQFDMETCNDAVEKLVSMEKELRKIDNSSFKLDEDTLTVTEQLKVCKRLLELLTDDSSDEEVVATHAEWERIFAHLWVDAENDDEEEVDEEAKDKTNIDEESAMRYIPRNKRLRIKLELGEEADDEMEKDELIDRCRAGEGELLVGWKIDLTQWMGGDGIIVGITLDAKLKGKDGKPRKKYRVFRDHKLVVLDLLKRTVKRNLINENLLEFNPPELAGVIYEEDGEGGDDEGSNSDGGDGNASGADGGRTSATSATDQSDTEAGATSGTDGGGTDTEAGTDGEKSDAGTDGDKSEADGDKSDAASNPDDGKTSDADDSEKSDADDDAVSETSEGGDTD